MAKVDGSLRSLLQGVSQQSPQNRLPGQCSEQINMSSNPVVGLTRRAPMEEIAKLFNSSATTQWYDFDLGGTGQQYVAAIQSGVLRVFDLTGTEKTVHDPNSTLSYLTGGPIAGSTFEGTTYIADKAAIPAMTSSTQSYITTGALVYALGGQYGRVYQIDINWSGSPISVSYTSPDGSTGSDSTKVTTTYIITQLVAALNANGTFTGSFSATQATDVIYIKKTASPTTEIFQVSVQDGDGGTNLYVVNNQIKDAANLPRYAPQGYLVTVSGDPAQNVDNYYLQFNSIKSGTTMGNGFGIDGTWDECVAPSVNFNINKTTMPHQLTYNSGADDFTWDAVTWADRGAGDDITNAKPSFIGRAINDITYFQGRLMFLAGPACILSQTIDLEKSTPISFWKDSATQLVDTDRIDIQSTAKGVKSMLKATPYNRDMIIWSNRGQFILFGVNALTPTNCSLVLTTVFDTAETAAPTPSGKNVFFPFNYGNYTGIKEFYTTPALDANDARGISLHIPTYMPGNPVFLTSSPSFDILLVQTDTSQSTLYTYEFVWNDMQKIQSSWSKWEMPLSIVYSWIFEAQMYMISKSGNNYLLNTVQLDLQNDTGLTYAVRLDRKKHTTVASTTLATPYSVPVSDPTTIVFVQGEGCPNPGMRAWVSSYDAGTDTYTFHQNMGGGTVYYGVKFTSTYIPTEPMIKDQDNIKINTGKLRVSKFFVTTSLTSKFWSTVSSDYFDDITYEWSARKVGDAADLVGTPCITSAVYQVPFRENIDNAIITLYSDDFGPWTMNDIQWKGQYTHKGQRIVTGGQL